MAGTYLPAGAYRMARRHPASHRHHGRGVLPDIVSPAPSAGRWASWASSTAAGEPSRIPVA